MIDLLADNALRSFRDLVPIVLVLAAFRALVVRESLRDLRRVAIGLVHVFVGLTLFRFGLDTSLVPMGGLLAERLVETSALAEGATRMVDMAWLLLFAAGIGLSATMIEPTLTAIANRMRDLTGGAMNAWHFRLVVAIGVAAGLTLGAYRAVAGVPLEYVVLPVLGLVALLAALARREIVPIALDSGAMATSIVTVPLIAAFGLSLAATIPGSDPLLDGFGLVFLALLLPVTSVLTFSLVRFTRRSSQNPET